MPTPILEALLDSVAAQAHQLRCVDISLERWAVPWFSRNGIDPNLDQEKQSSHSCDLVICSTDQLEQANNLAIAGGLILAHGSLEDCPSGSDTLSSLQQTARICSENVDWTLFAVPAKTEYDLAIVLIARNQGPQLREYLEIFAANECSFPWQLIVADLDSNDFTSELLDAVDGDISTLSLPADTPTGQILLHGLSRVESRLALLATLSVIPDANWLDTIYTAEKSFPDDNIFLGQLEAQGPPHAKVNIAIPPMLFAVRMTPELMQFDFNSHNEIQQCLNSMIARHGPPRVVPSLFGQIRNQEPEIDLSKPTKAG